MPTIPREQLYDVAEVIKTIYAATIKADPPRVSPTQLLPVVVYLEDVTKKSREHMQRLKQSVSASGVLPGRGNILGVLQGIQTELNRWDLELSNYSVAVRACINTENADNNECTLWNVVAPLFFGIYDGPLGTSSPKAPGLRAPFQIANQLNELQHFENTEGLDGWRYIGEETAKTFAAIGEGVAGSLRLMGEVAGKAIAGAAGGLIEGFGPALTIGASLLALFWVFRGKKKG